MVDRKDARTVLRNTTPGAEFLRTRDANFRPVWMATTPGGQLAIVDMHRGIIQQGNWTKPGSYLRGIIDKWGLAKNIGRGRIYRLVNEDFDAGPQPRMLEQATTELVKHLSHPNGWWRDTAQKLIILRPDRDSVVPALNELVLHGSSEFGRLHALWTLEGIGEVDPAVLAAALRDEASIVRTSAVRVAEPFRAEESAPVIEVLTGTLREDPEVLVHILNSLAASGTQHPGLQAVGRRIEDEHGGSEVIKAVLRSRLAAADERRRAAAARKQNARFAASMERGRVIYEQLCFTCHGGDGQGAPMVGRPGEKLAPSFATSPRIGGSGESVVGVLLHGLTGEVDGRTYEGLMVPMAMNDNQWIADVATFVRNSFGNKASAVSPQLVAALRKKHGDRATPWTVEELEALQPPTLNNQSDWKFTASHKWKALPRAWDGDRSTRYDTGAYQVPGMWMQIEFPTRTRLSGISLDTRGSDRDYPRGWEVRVSDDGNGKSWGDPVASGVGTEPLLEIPLPKVEGRFLRITQTGRVDGLFWSIHELQILGKPL